MEKDVHDNPAGKELIAQSNDNPEVPNQEISDAVPSTSAESNIDVSSKASESEIVELWKSMDETLEQKAKSHNLSAFNVKSILHHFIKNPSILPMFMGIQDDNPDIPSVKMTRSKAKVQKEKLQKELKLRPVDEIMNEVRPKTFLDVNYGEEEEDEEYVPTPEELAQKAADEAHNVSDEEESDEDEGEDEEEEEIDLSEVAELTAETSIELPEDREDSRTPEREYQLRSRVGNLNDAAMFDDLAESSDLLFGDDSTQMFSVVDDCYREFITNLHVPEDDPVIQNNLHIYDEADDADYNPLEEEEDVEEEDKDDPRLIRAQIPKREVENMFRDLLDDEAIQDIIMDKPCKTPVTKTIPKRRARPVRRKTAPVPDSDSCSLISGASVLFRDSEYDQLSTQLEQHVQLLTQTITMCHYDDKLFYIRDECQLMINQLDTSFYENGFESFYNISNLEGSIKTCHELLSMERVDNSLVRWKNALVSGFYPRPESCCLMMKSEAILYPELVPNVAPSYGVGCSNMFSNIDDILMILALNQFGHIDSVSCTASNGKFYLMNKHVLRGKSPLQIRSHLSAIRTERLNSFIHSLIRDAETNYPILVIEQPFTTRFESTMDKWPSEWQPIWYTTFCECFDTSEPDKVVPIPRKSPSKPPPKKTIPPRKSLRIPVKVKCPPLMQKDAVENTLNAAIDNMLPVFEGQPIESVVNKPSGPVEAKVMIQSTPVKQMIENSETIPIQIPPNSSLVFGSPEFGYQVIDLSKQQVFLMGNDKSAMQMPMPFASEQKLRIMNETTCNDMEQARGIDNGTPLDVVTVDEAVIPFSEETIVPFVEQTDITDIPYEEGKPAVCKKLTMTPTLSPKKKRIAKRLPKPPLAKTFSMVTRSAKRKLVPEPPPIPSPKPKETKTAKGPTRRKPVNNNVSPEESLKKPSVAIGKKPAKRARRIICCSDDEDVDVVGTSSLSENEVPANVKLSEYEAAEVLNSLIKSVPQSPSPKKTVISTVLVTDITKKTIMESSSTSEVYQEEFVILKTEQDAEISVGAPVKLDCSLDPTLVEQKIYTTNTSTNDDVLTDKLPEMAKRKRTRTTKKGAKSKQKSSKGPEEVDDDGPGCSNTKSKRRKGVGCSQPEVVVDVDEDDENASWANSADESDPNMPTSFAGLMETERHVASSSEVLNSEQQNEDVEPGVLNTTHTSSGTEKDSVSLPSFSESNKSKEGFNSSGASSSPTKSDHFSPIGDTTSPDKHDNTPLEVITSTSRNALPPPEDFMFEPLNDFIPRTPGRYTPSETLVFPSPPLHYLEMMTKEKTPTPDKIPRTPRDEGYTVSPTLLGFFDTPNKLDSSPSHSLSTPRRQARRNINEVLETLRQSPLRTKPSPKKPTTFPMISGKPSGSFFTRQDSMPSTSHAPLDPRSYKPQKTTTPCKAQVVQYMMSPPVIPFHPPPLPLPTQLPPQLTPQKPRTSRTSKKPSSSSFVSPPSNPTTSLDPGLPSTSRPPIPTIVVTEDPSPNPDATDGQPPVKKVRKRKKADIREMFVNRLANEDYRHQQKLRLAKKIVQDVKKRLAMHQNVYKQLQKIMVMDAPPSVQMDKLEELLLPMHLDAFCLLSLNLDDEHLSLDLLRHPLRRAYKGALDILMAIDAYSSDLESGKRITKTKAKNFYKALMQGEQPLTADTVLPVLDKLLHRDDPLFLYLSKYLNLPYPTPDPDDDRYEYIDMTTCSVTDKDVKREHLHVLPTLASNSPPRPAEPGIVYSNGNFYYNRCEGKAIPLVVNFKRMPRPRAPRTSPKKKNTEKTSTKDSAKEAGSTTEPSESASISQSSSTIDTLPSSSTVSAPPVSKPSSRNTLLVPPPIPTRRSPRRPSVSVPKPPPLPSPRLQPPPLPLSRPQPPPLLQPSSQPSSSSQPPSLPPPPVNSSYSMPSTSREPVWTEALDTQILMTYCELDTDNVEEILSQLSKTMSYAKDCIRRRLEFLLSHAS